jgi:hypothetical protein
MNISDKDQLYAGLRDLAEITFKYYSKLIKEGFTPEQAILLVVNFQATTIQNNK